MYTYAQIMRILQPKVGSRMLPYLEDACQKVLSRFAGFSGRDDLDDLTHWLETFLYSRVRDVTMGRMIAGLDDATLYDAYEGLPSKILKREPIRGACELCPMRNDDDCYEDQVECDKQISAWMAAEALPK